MKNKNDSSSSKNSRKSNRSGSRESSTLMNTGVSKPTITKTIPSEYFFRLNNIYRSDRVFRRHSFFSNKDIRLPPTRGLKQRGTIMGLSFGTNKP